MNGKHSTRENAKNPPRMMPTDIRGYVARLEALVNEYNAARKMAQSASDNQELRATPITASTINTEVPASVQIARLKIREVGWRILAEYGYQGMHDVCEACSEHASLCVDRRWSGIGDGKNIWVS